MDIKSTDKEWEQSLRNKNISIPKYNSAKEMEVTDKNASYSKLLKDFVKDKGIDEIPLTLKNCKESVVLSNKTIRESICHTHNLSALMKMLTVLRPVADASILVDVEKYRHTENPKIHTIKAENIYLSAFYDDDKVYPVKFVAEKYTDGKEKLYVAAVMDGIKKEALSNAGISLKEKNLPNGVTSMSVSITDLIRMFNRNQGMILKNLPNGLLSDKQIQIKERVILKDEQKELKLREINKNIRNLKRERDEIKNNNEIDEYEYV